MIALEGGKKATHEEEGLNREHRRQEEGGHETKESSADARSVIFSITERPESRKEDKGYMSSETECPKQASFTTTVPRDQVVETVGA